MYTVKKQDHWSGSNQAQSPFTRLLTAPYLLFSSSPLNQRTSGIGHCHRPWFGGFALSFGCQIFEYCRKPTTHFHCLLPLTWVADGNFLVKCSVITSLPAWPGNDVIISGNLRYSHQILWLNIVFWVNTRALSPAWWCHFCYRCLDPPLLQQNSCYTWTGKTSKPRR